MMRALVLLLASAAPLATANTATPIEKVVQLLSDLQTKILAEGSAAQKTYEEFAEWCEERSKDLGFEIKTAKASAAELEASIAKDTATIGSLNAKIDELSAAVATDEADLKAAREIRNKEKTDFDAEQAELSDVISMLERALSILEREMAKSGASMMQLKNAGSVAQALNVMVTASVMSAADASRLTALVQSTQSSDSDDIGAPDAAVYQGHGGDIIETLQSLLDKANSQLSDARKTETANLHNFQMLEQSLLDEIKFGNSDIEKAKKGRADSSSSKASAEGGLAVTNKDIATDSTSLADLHQLCLSKSQDYEAEVASRDEELKALAQAKKVITEETGAANGRQYSFAQVSLMQLSSNSDLANMEAVRYLFDLAQKQGSAALAQMASRLSAVMKSGARNGQDPFAKIKGLISDMIARLESEADADASHKAYCDKEFAETNVKKDDKTAEIAKLTASIDKMTARSSQLKEEVARLQKELAELAASQGEMDKLRGEENDEYKKSRADMEQGLAGVKLALKVLREYYAQADKDHSAAQGAADSIIGLLEVIESDFTKTLAQLISTEEAAAAAYDKQTKQNAIEKTSKDQDERYKAKESSDLDKAVNEASTDRSGVQTELDAVMEYMDSLHKQCDEKVEPYHERKRRREAEIAGLKEALTILEGQASLMQKKKRHLRVHSVVA